MAIEVIEKVDSRESTTGRNATVDLKYIVTGTASDVEAKDALASTAPAYYDNLVRQSRHIEPVGDPTVSLTWEGTVRYGVSEPPPETGESSFSFDTGGGTQHITQSISTEHSYAAAGQTAPDFKGAIGVTRDNVEGVDIALPVYNFSETHYFDDADVTDTYKALLFHKTGMYNNDAFKGFSPGEVLFLGASGSKRGAGDWEITFRFAASQNRSDIMVGDIGPISKKGWEYMWVRYEDAEDTAAKALIKKPVAVYIEKVYYGTDFTSLGIGN
jgi:hypothetical protein